MILVEADGSKRLPVKVPGPKEPVIPENSDQIFVSMALALWENRQPTAVSDAAVRTAFKNTRGSKRWKMDHDRGENVSV